MRPRQRSADGQNRDPDGLGAPPATICWMALAMRASSLSSATLSTADFCEAPTMSLRSAKFSASLAAKPMLAASQMGKLRFAGDFLVIERPKIVLISTQNPVDN